MGRNINEFVVKVLYDANGSPTTATYWDQEGCGHEHPFNAETGSMVTLREVVDYHLTHYQKSHHMHPPVRCPFEVTSVDLETKATISFHCVMDPHPRGTRHQLEQD